MRDVFVIIFLCQSIYTTIKLAAPNNHLNTAYFTITAYLQLSGLQLSTVHNTCGARYNSSSRAPRIELQLPAPITGQSIFVIKIIVMFRFVSTSCHAADSCMEGSYFKALVLVCKDFELIFCMSCDK